MGFVNTSPAPTITRATPPSMYKVSLSDPFVPSARSMISRAIGVSLRDGMSSSFLCGKLARKNSSDERVNELYGFVNGRCYGLAEPHSPFFRTESGRYATDKQYALQRSAHAGRHAQHVERIHSVGLDKAGLCWRRTQLFPVRFDDEESTWLALSVARISVHKNCRLVTFHQSVREVEAADSEFCDA